MWGALVMARLAHVP